ncbi:YhgE/Pip domain-containing protein [Acaricomes phytoseiuli]|uniref:YhgE/Pip domain-containing protein n=1 Tax=Acaricomes phytoseiuli TaxID=291968 RepID=UPI00037DCF21|nr:YhgE/Pip domain-containing protein [Acaricomes phytoseiuli]MCW1249915.1 YhgE/Pip domain-containing protein [Acaricomes phytoseiuli]
MTTIRLALSELKRMTSGRLPKLSLLALLLVPLLYGAVYLYANWDPYQNLGGIKAAVVNEDQGAADSQGKPLAVGDQVTQKLIDAQTFDWVQVDSPTEADAGVARGEYSFALKIPRDFSANLASPADFDAARQALLNVTTNDANNYLLSPIVDKVSTEVHASVAREVGEATANQLLTGFGTIHQQIAKAADGAAQVADGASELRDGSGQLRDGSSRLAQGAGQLADGQQQLASGAGQLADGSGRLAAGLQELDLRTAELPGASARLADGAAQVAQGNAKLSRTVQGWVSKLQDADQQASAQLDQVLQRLVDSGTITPAQRTEITQTITQDLQPVKAEIRDGAADIQRLADGSQAVADGAKTLADSAPQLTAGISQASSGAQQLAGGAQQLSDGQQKAASASQQLASGAQQLDEGAGRLAEGSTRLADGSRELADQLQLGAGKIPNPDEATKDTASKVIGDPVAVNSLAQTSAGSYGAGLAPFFLVLALWIGAFMLVQAMRPLTQRALAGNAPAWKVALGGWLPFLTVSIVQAMLLYSVVYFALGLNPSHPWLTLGLLLAASMAFTALIQGIVALLGTPGKFVVLILLVLQLVSSGGTFPWQTTPEPLHPVHMILPMGYVVEGLRALIYGASLAALPQILLILLVHTVIGLLLSVLAVHRHQYWTLKKLQPEIVI